MSEQPQGESSAAGTADVPAAVLSALRSARTPLRWVAVLSIACAVMLLAIAAVLLLLSITDSDATAREATAQLPVVGLFVLASALAGYLGARAWMAASSLRTAERIGAPHPLRFALLSMTGAWWALALALGVALLFPVLLLVASLWSLSRALA